jgi:hypothetical protein
MEQILGIEPVAAGFAQVAIRPDLCGLQWVRGSEACPQGSIKVDYQQENSDFQARIEIPEGVTAQVSMPVGLGEGSVQVDGRAISGVLTEDGTRRDVIIRGPGLHELSSRLSLP